MVPNVSKASLPLWWIAVAVITALGAEACNYFKPKVSLSPTLAVGSLECVEQCARTFECIEESVKAADRDCVGNVDLCLARCPNPLLPGGEPLELTYALGEAPPWQLLSSRLGKGVDGLTRCSTQTQTFTSVIDLTASGSLGSVSASQQDGVGACVDEQLLKVDFSDLTDASYRLVLRGRIEAAAPPPAPSEPSADRRDEAGAPPPDFLTQLNRLNPQGSADAIPQPKPAEVVPDEPEQAKPRATSSGSEPRLLAVLSLADEVTASLGSPAVLILYDSRSKDSGPFLVAASQLMARFKSRVRFHVYSVDGESDHERWLTLMEELGSQRFERVRVTGARGGMISSQLKRLKVRRELGAPAVVLFDAAGSVVLEESGLSSLPDLAREIASSIGAPPPRVDMVRLEHMSNDGSWRRSPSVLY